MVCKLYPSQLLKIKMCPVIEMKQKFVELLEHKKSPSQGFNVDNRLPIRHTQHADAKTLPVEGGVGLRDTVLPDKSLRFSPK